MSMFAGSVEPNGKTHFVKTLQTIAGLLGPPKPGCEHEIFMTSSDWALLAREILCDYRSSLVNPLVLLTPENFNSVKIGEVMFRNAGTEDERAVLATNAVRYRESRFQEHRLSLIAGRA